MKRLLLLVLCSLITACATLPQANQAHNAALSWKQRQTALTALTAWTIQGALAIGTAHTSESASLYLRQHQHHYQIDLFGPLGIGRNSLQGKPGEVTLTTSQGQQLHASSPEQLLHDTLGWSLPVSNLYYWLRGLPAPGITRHIRFDAYHHIHQLKQQGWSITYQRYAAVQQHDLPTEILLRYEGLRIKIVISQWQLTHSSSFTSTV